MIDCHLYQIVHTLGGAIYHLEEHLKVLFEGYYEIYGTGVKMSQATVQEQITTLLERSRCPKDVSLFIRCELTRSGQIKVSEHERSLYRGYSLRCISPRAAIIEFHMPYIEFPTSVRDEMIEFANAQALRKGGDVALRAHNGVIDLINGAQIFAVTPQGLITAADSFTPEHRLAKLAARELEINVIERPIRIGEMPLIDELFYVDHYGVTAIRTCAMQSFMSITASALATRLAALMAER